MRPGLPRVHHERNLAVRCSRLTAIHLEVYSVATSGGEERDMWSSPHTATVNRWTRSGSSAAPEAIRLWSSSSSGSTREPEALDALEGGLDCSRTDDDQLPIAHELGYDGAYAVLADQVGPATEQHAGQLGNHLRRDDTGRPNEETRQEARRKCLLGRLSSIEEIDKDVGVDEDAHASGTVRAGTSLRATCARWARPTD